MSNPAGRTWLAESIVAGLEIIDTPQMLREVATHVTTEGEFAPQRVSPSLLATDCRLSRVKQFLGHAGAPGTAPHMASRQGKPDAVTQLNFTRGFLAEGMVISAFNARHPERIKAKAPTFLPQFQQDGYEWSAHPDLLIQDEDDRLALVQVKSPSVYKFKRVETGGAKEALSSYLMQLATELLICQRAGWPVVRNHLLLFSWDGLPGTRVLCWSYTVEADPDILHMPLTRFQELVEDLMVYEEQDVMPAPLAKHMADSFPCSYCRYNRLGEAGIPACDNAAAWKPQLVKT
jgi:hypothetical protein